MPLQIIRQDITKMQGDAIVGTTNAEMMALCVAEREYLAGVYEDNV